MSLNVGGPMPISFPARFDCTITRVYPDEATGDMVLREASSTYNYVPSTTVNANTTGKTMWDLVYAQVRTLEQQGYQKQ